MSHDDPVDAALPADDYLWDRTGAPDPEVVALERALGHFRHRAPPSAARPRVHSWRLRIGAAAAVLAGVVAVHALRNRIADDQPPPQLTRLPAPDAPRAPRVDVLDGASFDTGPGERAALELRGIGNIEVGPETRLRVLDGTGPTRRLYLERGRLRATVIADPEVFQVGTPAGLAIDMGCVYTIEVDRAGVARLQVELGQVAFENAGRRVLVPRGSHCRAAPQQVPGTPVRNDAPPALVAAAGAFDAGGALAPMLAQSTAADAVTLWNLLAHHPDLAVREAAYARLAELCGAPPAADRAPLLARDSGALGRWWRELGLGW